MDTNTDPNTLIEEAERELARIEAAALAEPEDEPTPDPMGDHPAAYQVELVDGARMRVPLDEPHRSQFFEERRAAKEAAEKAQAARDELVSEYLAASPFERATKWTARQAAAIEALLPTEGGSPV